MTTREPRVLLIRHGRSALVTNGEWVDADGIHRWRAAYDAAGIADDPSPALVHEITRADVVMASDLPRAIASAERLAPGREIVVSPLLREAELDLPTWVPFRWPLGVWSAVIHLQWNWQILRGTDASADELARVGSAAGQIAELAGNRGRVAVVTHGVVRRLIARRLIADGWRSDSGLWNYRNWSVWDLRPT